jgi:hypothetical protein
LDYLKKTLEPALRKLGANHFMLFSELGGSDPQIIRLLISYPNANVYFQAQQLSHDPDFIKAATTYNTHKNDIYTRFSSSLLWAFDGFPKLKNPIDGASLFELRTYEGYNEDAVRRKIKMFNKEEFPVFDEVGLNSVFFGEVIAGPQRPCLIYLLSFKDMEAHDVAWKKFFSHPEWDRMKVLPEYANTVSHIEKVFLKLM